MEFYIHHSVYFESQRSHLILCLYQGLNLGPSDPEADDIQTCHHASLVVLKLVLKCHLDEHLGEEQHFNVSNCRQVYSLNE